MTLATTSTLGGAAVLLLFAWTALGGGGPDGGDVPPATPDLPRADYVTPASHPSIGLATMRTAAQGVADAQALEEILAAVDGMTPLACELAAGGVHGYWPGRRFRPLAGDGTRAARRLQAGVAAARTEAGAEALVESLLGGSGCRVRLALGLLDRAEPSLAAPLIRPHLTDSQADRRLRAALGLGAVESAPDRAALERLLGDEASDVRAAAAWALGEIEDPAAIPALSRVLAGDADPEVRGAAAEALGEIAG